MNLSTLDRLRSKEEELGEGKLQCSWNQSFFRVLKVVWNEEGFTKLFT